MPECSSSCAKYSNSYADVRDTMLGIKCLFSLLIHISPGKLNGHNGLYPVSLLLSSYL